MEKHTKKKRDLMKSIAGNLYCNTLLRVSVPSKSSMSVSRRTFPTPVLPGSKFYTSHPMRKCKAVKLAVLLVSVFNYDLRIICNIYKEA